MAFNVGDHILATRIISIDGRNYMYYHHGIYIGNVYCVHGQRGFGHFVPSVVHFTGPDYNKTSARILLTTLDKFRNGGQLKEPYPNNGQYLPAFEVACIARYYAQHPDQWGEYNIFTNNCWHFANNCKTGRINPFAKQIQAGNYSDTLRWQYYGWGQSFYNLCN